MKLCLTARSWSASYAHTARVRRTSATSHVGLRRATSSRTGASDSPQDAAIRPDRRQSFIFDAEEFRQHELDKASEPSPASSAGHKARSPSQSTSTKHLRRDAKSDLKSAYEAWRDATVDDLYATMLRSPIRKCAITQAKLPRDFLVAFRQVRTADASTLQTFRVDSAINSVGTIERNYVLPSRVVHPRFETRRNGKARYVLCHRASIEQLAGKAINRLFPSSALAHANIANEVEAQLAHRIIQEAELLALRYETWRGERSADQKDQSPVRVVTADERSAWDAGPAISSFEHVQAIVVDDIADVDRCSTNILASSAPIYRLSCLPEGLVDNLRKWLKRCSGLRVGKTTADDGAENAVGGAWIIATKPQGLSHTLHPYPDAMPLSIALHRLRMFQDPQLWTGPGNNTPADGWTRVRGFYGAGENACMDTTLSNW